MHGIVQNFECIIRTLKDDIDIIFVCIARGGTVVIIFQEFLGKSRSCVLLNKTAQNFIHKIHIIKSNNYIFFVYIP